MQLLNFAGRNANQLLFKNAPEGIKFALGENVNKLIGVVQTGTHKLVWV